MDLPPEIIHLIYQHCNLETKLQMQYSSHYVRSLVSKEDKEEMEKLVLLMNLQSACKQCHQIRIDINTIKNKVGCNSTLEDFRKICEMEYMQNHITPNKYVKFNINEIKNVPDDIQDVRRGVLVNFKDLTTGHLEGRGKEFTICIMKLVDNDNKTILTPNPLVGIYYVILKKQDYDTIYELVRINEIETKRRNRDIGTICVKLKRLDLNEQLYSELFYRKIPYSRYRRR
jgi:hypothetical protein